MKLIWMNFIKKLNLLSQLFFSKAKCLFPLLLSQDTADGGIGEGGVVKCWPPGERCFLSTGPQASADMYAAAVTRGLFPGHD